MYTDIKASDYIFDLCTKQSAFAWKISSKKHSCSGLQSQESKIREIKNIITWSTLLANSVSTKKRIVEVRYTNCDAQTEKIAIYLIGYVNHDKQKTKKKEIRNFWYDMFTAFSLIQNDCQFNPIKNSENWPKNSFQRASEISQVYQEIKGIHSNISGFAKETPSVKSSIFLPKKEIDEKETTTKLKSSCAVNSISQLISHYPFPISISLFFTVTALNGQELNTIESLLPLFQKGQTITCNKINLLSGSQEYSNIKNSLEKQRFYPSAMMRIIVLYNNAPSTTILNSLGANFCGEQSYFNHESLTETTKKNLENSFDIFPEKERWKYFICQQEMKAVLQKLISPEECEGFYSAKQHEISSQEGLLLGEKKQIDGSHDVKLSEKSRAQHVYILGQSGTGKSTLMVQMATQQILNGEGVGIIDPHGDLCEQMLNNIPPERLDDVVIFDPSCTEVITGFNPMEYSSNNLHSKSLVADSMMEVFSKLYKWNSIGGHAIVEHYLRGALFALMSDKNQQHTLLDLPRFLTNKHYRDKCLSGCEDYFVKEFWRNEAEKVNSARSSSLQSLAPWITVNLSKFVYNDFIRPIISRSNYFDFRKIMDEGKILIVNLSKGLIGCGNSDMLGMFVINRIFLAALSRQEILPEKRKNFTLYIDEFQNFTTNNIAHIFAETRKYCLSLVCANQNLSQLTPEVCNSALGTVGNMLCFRPGVSDVDIIQKWFRPTFSSGDLLELTNFEVASRILVDGKCQLLNFKTTPQNYTSSNAQEVKKHFFTKVAQFNREKKEFTQEDKQMILSDVLDVLGKIRKRETV